MKKIVINTRDRKNTINRNIYGHFSEHLGRCIYDGLFVGEDSAIPNDKGMRRDVVEALRHIRVPVLRWPGGCFADEYHWQDGIGPKADRKRMINTHWGGGVEDNSFGTHEFMELCDQIGCEPYVNGNMGSGTIREMSEWVEYMTFVGESPLANLRKANGREEPWRVKYFGIGNENWGCGGSMRPEYYADEYRRYQTYVRNYGDNKIYKIACGSSGLDYDWTEVVMRLANCCMDAITLHHYTVPGDWSSKGSATDFTVGDYYVTLKKALLMEELISNHLQIMNRHDPDHRIGLIVDEWGTWFDVEPGTNPGFLYQQSTMRDALVAALTLDIFNAHSDRVVMANIAQTVNVLQAVILTEGGKMLLTPTYHVFDLYKNHHDATLLGHWMEDGEIADGDVTIPDLSLTASEKNGRVTVTLANPAADKPVDVAIELPGNKVPSAAARVLSGAIAAKNTFDAPDTVSIRALDGVRAEGDMLRLTLPACSVTEIVIDG